MTTENQTTAATGGFGPLGIDGKLLESAARAGFVEPKPIQVAAIPAQIAGKDILGVAQTGSGKTAAFALPILKHIAALGDKRKAKTCRALILAPTRELAVQIEETIRAISKGLHISTSLVLGGVSRGGQVKRMAQGVDILVATPGRLTDLVRQNEIVLSETRWLVLDEADRMLDMGFLPSIKRVLARVPKQRQTMLFSATFESRIRGLAMELLNSPVEVQVATQNTIADTIVHRVHPVDASRKRDLLVEILSRRHTDRVLVFGKTKHGCNRLAEQLEKAGLPALAIHGNKSQAQRQKALDQFKSGKARILVATDVAARGLDIPSLPLVINHDLPMVAEDYVHRIGRTGRNGAQGEALSLVSPDEGGLLRQIQRLLKADIAMETVKGFEPSQPIRLDVNQPGRRGGGQKPGSGQRPPRKPAHRAHGKPAGRGAQAHAGARQGRGRSGARRGEGA